MATGEDRLASMERYQTPGVYLEEIVPEKAPEFRTGVPAFVGFVEASQASGQSANGFPKFRLLTRWEQFERQVGRAVAGGFLDYAVRGFFENGGERCIVVLLEPGSLALKEALKKPFEQEGPLEDIEDIDLVCVPDVMMASIRESQDGILEVQSEVLDYCRRMGDRFAILDAFLSRSGGQVTGVRLDTVLQWEALPPSDGALYFPWLCVKPLPRADQVAKDATYECAAGGVLVPPCGHVAGIYARTDARVGIHKAPANEIVEGALDLEVDLTDDDQAKLNEAGVNCLRAFPGRGIRVWGARTLSGQPNWRYVNVRRLFLTLTRWVERNLNDLVFEPNSPPLWERVRHRLGSYLYDLFQRGALKGHSPDEAFFVKCDAETNPLAVREAGRMIAEVGLAPVAPAEFVIVRITRSAAGVTVTTPTGF
jgi:uncharacterized protein